MRRFIKTGALVIPLSLVMAASTPPPALAQVIGQVGLPQVGVGVGGTGQTRTAPAGRYAMPPTGAMIKSSLAGEDLEKATAAELADLVDAIDSDLKDCTSMGRRISMEQSTGGGQAVHPGWIERYQSCLQQREEDLADLRDEVDDRDAPLTNVKADLDSLDRALRDAFQDQNRVVSDYNMGR